MRQSHWFLGKPSPNARARLFCLPHPGGSASSYMAWRNLLDPGIDLRAVEIPGRGKRFDETPCADSEALLEQLLPEIVPLLDSPAFFFGHCAGGRLAYAIADELVSSRSMEHAHVFLSAPSPPVASDSTRLSSASRNVLVDYLKLFGGTPEELLESEGFLDMALPVLRADLALCESCEIRNRTGRIGATILLGKRDVISGKERLEQWAPLVRDAPGVIEHSGAHFFLDCLPDVVGAISARVNALVA